MDTFVPDPIFQTLDRTARAPYPRSWYVRRLLWDCVQATLFRLPLPKGYAWRRLLLRCFGAKLGRAAAFARSTRVFHPWLLEVGDWCAISTGVTIYNLGPITVGHHTVISQDVYLCAGTHDYTNPTLPLLRPPINVGSGVWIAAGAFICPSVTIGDNALVAARAVVTRDVPPGMIVAGNPARVVKPRQMNRPA
jgi:putative colanic acid biosynthesis acetyltransferase WcaF